MCFLLTYGIIRVSQRDEIKNALTMGRKLGNMGNLMNGILVVGNELNEVDTLKSLAKTVLNSGELAGEIIGSGVLANVEELAENAYTETIEMLALYLATLVDGESSNEDDELDEYDDELDEDEDDDEDDDAICERCGAVIPEDEDGGDYLLTADQYVCYDCMSANEYKNR